MYSRRDFAKIALTSLPIARAWAAHINSTVNGVRLGTITYSFRDFPRTPGKDNVDAVIQALTECGIGEIELFSPNIEPGRAGGFGRGNTAEAAKAREELRQWRLTTPMEYFKDIRKKFDAAGINLYGYNYSFNDSFTDEEIDRGFDMAKALGVKIITASTTLPVAKRVVPFAEKHKMIVAMHGHSNLTDPNQFAKPESFAAAMAMSKYFKVNLDIGHFTAANYDAVDYIQKNHENIVLLHLKDRKKDEGPNVPWGEGDTPIKQVLLLLKEKKWPVPAFIEYEYKGTGTSQEEVKKCYDYCKQVLET